MQVCLFAFFLLQSQHKQFSLEAACILGLPRIRPRNKNVVSPSATDHLSLSLSLSLSPLSLSNKKKKKKIGSGMHPSQFLSDWVIFTLLEKKGEKCTQMLYFGVLFNKNNFKNIFRLTDPNIQKFHLRATQQFSFLGLAVCL